jgi:exonuclease SbcC
MQAFGPYAGVQELDFADLGGNDFFLITGPTGSGKTTVLDAMAFALYGDTSGGDRDARDMRSQHAAPDRLTEVEFDFVVGDARFRVLRRPQQQRPAKRGEGTVNQLQEATLWPLVPLSDGALAPGKPRADGWTDVTQAAEDILGFRCEQFRQVVMLPQGRFQELLQAKSQDKEKILSTLFDTAFYARVELALKGRAAAITKAHERLTIERGAVLGQAAVAGEDDLAVQMSAVDASIELAAADVTARGAELAEAQRALADARSVIQRLHELDIARRRLAEVRDESTRVDELRNELELARQAAPLAADDEAACARQREADARSGELEAARECLARRQAEHHVAGSRLTAEIARSPAREQAAEEVRRLKALEPRVTGVGELADEVATAVDELQAADAEAQSARAQAGAADRERAVADRSLHEARAAAAGAPALRSVAEQAAVVAKQRRDFDAAGGRLDAAVAEATRLTGLAAAADERYDIAVDRLRRLESDWHAGQAAKLAESLAPGEPCPVCGATEHPAPARAGDHAVPTDDDLDAARATLDRLFGERDAARLGLAESQRRRAQATTQRDQLARALGDAAVQPVEACDERARVATAAAETAVAAEASLAALETGAHTALETHEQAVAAARVADEAVARRRSAHDALAARLAERRSGVPPELADPTALAAAITAAEASRRALDEALDATRDAAGLSAVALEKARGDVAHAEAQAESAREAAKVAGERFAAHLADQGFSDEAAWREARRDAAQTAALSAEVHAYDDQVVAAAATFAHAERAAAGLEPVDVEGLESAAARALAHAEEAAAVKARADARFKTLDHARSELARIAAESAGLDEHYAVVGRIAQVATGDNPMRLNFQRFVLGVHLDRVLEIASLRLREMTSKRYELERSGQARGRARIAGLDLDVFDAWTGESRPVSTLSGGESFMAALSLALGLAEAVQELSGGIRLDTIFVDEGFGSLDAEALDHAITTLTTLQESGRLVGIISHLAEVKERVDARLEVTIAKTGSSARFVVP